MPLPHVAVPMITLGSLLRQTPVFIVEYPLLRSATLQLENLVAAGMLLGNVKESHTVTIKVTGYLKDRHDTSWLITITAANSCKQ